MVDNSKIQSWHYKCPQCELSWLNHLYKQVNQVCSIWSQIFFLSCSFLKESVESSSWLCTISLIRCVIGLVSKLYSCQLWKVLWSGKGVKSGFDLYPQEAAGVKKKKDVAITRWLIKKISADSWCCSQAAMVTAACILVADLQVTLWPNTYPFKKRPQNTGPWREAMSKASQVSIYAFISPLFQLEILIMIQLQPLKQPHQVLQIHQARPQSLKGVCRAVKSRCSS